MSNLHYLHNTHIPETTLTTTPSLIWTGNYILTYAIFQCSSDAILLSLWNDSQQALVFNLSSMKQDYRLDDGDLFQPILKMYSQNRWVLDFRLFGGLYPQGLTGVEIKMEALTGTKTLENAMIFWSER